MNPKSSVLVLYENGTARDRAVQFCDSLVQRFWPTFGFDLSWCDWQRLQDPKQAKEFTQKAVETELLVVATGGQGKLPLHVRDWLELSLQDRGDREGVLVDLYVAEIGCNPEASATQLYLRKFAHLCGMDYLTAVPESLPHCFPESPESYTFRATQVTNVLAGILQQSSLRPRMVVNV